MKNGTRETSVKNRRKAGVLVDKENREKDDYYNTPQEAVFSLLEREKFLGAIWEPACGEGHISEALSARGYEVISTDLVDRGYGTPRVDFLMETKPLASNIITNPPFKLASQFIINSLNLTTGKVAMFLPLSYLSSQGRKRDIWDCTPIKTVYVFSHRVASHRNGKKTGKGGGMINFAWYVWEHGYTGRPMIEWI
jgi:hypothetical protein